MTGESREFISGCLEYHLGAKRVLVPDGGNLIPDADEGGSAALERDHVFTVRLQSGMTLVGRITLPRHFTGGSQLLQTIEQADRLLCVKCPPAFLRMDAVEGGRMMPHMVATSSIESIAPCTLDAEQWAALHAVALA